MKYLQLLLLFLLAACGHDSAAPQPRPPTDRVLASIEIFPGPQNVGIGDSIRYHAVAFDNTGREVQGVRVVWSSSNTAVVRIDSAGAALAVGAGSAEITATGPEGLKKSESVVVRAPIMPVPLDSAFVSVVVFGQSRCALSTESRVFCWRSQDAPQYVATPRPLKTLAANGDYICGLDEAGSAFCWGASESWLPYQTEPQPIGAPPLVQIAVGRSHACGLTAAGTTHCWGSGINSRHELSNQTTDIRFVRLAASDRYTCGITVERDVACWGGADHSAFFGTAQGDSRCSASAFWTEPCSTVPIRIPGTANAVELSMDGTRHCYIDTDGKLHCWGVVGPGANCTYGGKYGGFCLFTPYELADSRVLHGFVNGTVLDESGSLLIVRTTVFSNGTSPPPFRLEEPQPGVRFIAAGGGNCGITAARKILCW